MVKAPKQPEPPDDLIFVPGEVQSAFLHFIQYCLDDSNDIPARLGYAAHKTDQILTDATPASDESWARWHEAIEEWESFDDRARELFREWIDYRAQCSPKDYPV